ncbi:hypothetical protein ACM26V_13630 [Salipaludibacillus sp. HK11]|uniref:hypothetical protein n=1 Tax=Salipaludibacillus sp. HK11 TaxID=3394320 RepID=UPI0039FBD59C
MKKLFSGPKGFGEILDLTFQLSKSRFKDFAKIFLIIMGPIILLEALVQFAYGMSFFRETGPGSNWFEQIVSSFEGNEAEFSTNLAADLMILFLAFINMLLFPIAMAAVLIVVNHLRKGEEYTVGSVIKQAFSRFWAILGSNILLFLIIMGLIFVPVMMIIVGAFVVDGFIAVIIIGLLAGLAYALGFSLFFTRISFYFGSVVIDKVTPGFIKSWKLSRSRTWVLFGLYVVLYLIIGLINVASEATFGIFLGNSVLMLLINNFVWLFTSIILSVGYAVMFFDLKTRNHGDDVKDLLADYNEDNR